MDVRCLGEPNYVLNQAFKLMAIPTACMFITLSWK